MAKDPAMLWYWSDWNSGTCLLSRFLKGCYIDLLHAQFNNGRLSLEEIKVCLGSDFGTSWPTLQKKFKQDESGLFFNERTEIEKQKRASFCESRRKNKEKGTHVESYDEHMNNRMENTNTVFNKKEIEIENFVPTVSGLKPDASNLNLELPEITIGAAQQYFAFAKGLRDIPRETIIGLWQVFKIKEFTGRKYYPDIGNVFSHFINCLKYEKLEDIKPVEQIASNSFNDSLKAVKKRIA
jgi:hypothetical protein